MILPHPVTHQMDHITLELAPLHLVPHAIHLFLEQVAHGLWSNNNTNLYYSSGHLLQMGPFWTEQEEHLLHENDNYTKKALVPFQEHQLDGLSFPDYSPQFPHVEWTLGMAGRPGGPDIYINRRDNSRIHGPGGQIHQVLDEQGDSCFAKIVEGFDLLLALHRMPHRPDDDDLAGFLYEPVPIWQTFIEGWKADGERVVAADEPWST